MPKLAAMIDFPTPPFWLDSAIIFAILTPPYVTRDSLNTISEMTLYCMISHPFFNNKPLPKVRVNNTAQGIILVGLCIPEAAVFKLAGSCANKSIRF